MKHVLAIVALVGLSFLVHAVASGAGPDRPKNLKFYPKGTSKAALKKEMKSISRALGVECEDCHDRDDMAKETPEKETARKYLELTRSLNQGELKRYGKITCATCHRGKRKPER